MGAGIGATTPHGMQTSHSRGTRLLRFKCLHKQLETLLAAWNTPVDAAAAAAAVGMAHIAAEVPDGKPT